MKDKGKFLASVEAQADGFKPVYVDMRNVSRWFYSVNPQEEFVFARDFPNLMIPWPFAIFEWIVPRRLNVEGEIFNSPVQLEYFARVGFFEANNTDAINNTMYDFAYRHKGLEYLRNTKGKDVYRQSEPYAEMLEDLEDREVAYTGVFNVTMVAPIPVFVGVFGIYVDSLGRPLGGPQALVTLPAAEIWAKNDDVAPILYPVFYAISLLHCKNVELVDRPIKRAERRRAERTNTPLTQYKQLKIEPLIARQQTKGQNKGDGSKRSLHIVRGHFATYTEDAPLFGRHTGTFWKPMHVRGSGTVGEVRKSYNIKGR